MFDLNAALPFVVIALAFPLGGLLVRAVARGSGEEPQVVNGEQATPVSAFLDWAVDVTQVVPIIAIPIIALIFERSREQWALPAMALVGLLLLGAAVRTLLTAPERYAHRRFWGLTILACVGIAFNLAVAVILGFGWLRDADYVSAAEDTVAVASVTHQTDAAPNTYVVRLEIKGGAESLAGRIPWVANSRYKESADIRDDADLFWTGSPCTPGVDDTWECRNVYLGEDTECGLDLNIFPALVDATGITGMMTGWREHTNGAFPAPAGVDAPAPTKFTRPQDEQVCTAAG